MNTARSWSTRSASLHPNEPVLVFRTAAGHWLPTHEYADAQEDASALGREHLAALYTQVQRQTGFDQ